jgi:hypothetical protein
MSGQFLVVWFDNMIQVATRLTLLTCNATSFNFQLLVAFVSAYAF